jgi:hypothetical protein
MTNKTATHAEPREQVLAPQDWIGYEVHDLLGQRIGQAEEVFANADDDPEYIRVKIGLLGSKSVLIPVKLAAADVERRVIELR